MSRLVQVAKWRARGMHAGMVVPFRRVAPLQLWHVRVSVQRPECSDVDARDQLLFDAPQACSIRDMHAAVMAQLSEIVRDGERVRDAEFGFYVRQT